MVNPLYRQYSVNDFDSFDCLKLSKVIYLILAFVLRGYLIWFASVANFSDRTGVLAMVYPNKNLFYLSLISGAFALFVLLLICLRKPSAPSWVKACWPHVRYLLLSALLIDLMVSYVALFYQGYSLDTWLTIQTACVFVLAWLALASKRLTLNLNEFPQTLSKPKG